MTKANFLFRTSVALLLKLSIGRSGRQVHVKTCRPDRKVVGPVVWCAVTDKVQFSGAFVANQLCVNDIAVLNLQNIHVDCGTDTVAFYSDNQHR